MRLVYGLATLLGVVLLFAWIGLTSAARAVPAWSKFDPERRFGGWGRSVVAAILGFGLGGMSASYGGWPVAAALAGGVGGAALLTFTAVRLGPRGTE